MGLGSGIGAFVYSLTRRHGPQGARSRTRGRQCGAKENWRCAQEESQRDQAPVPPSRDAAQLPRPPGGLRIAPILRARQKLPSGSGDAFEARIVLLSEKKSNRKELQEIVSPATLTSDPFAGDRAGARPTSEAHAGGTSPALVSGGGTTPPIRRSMGSASCRCPVLHDSVEV